MITIKLKEQLKKIGKNATEVAEDTGINRNSINALVNDRVEGIKFQTLEKICETYNLNISDLIDYSPSQKTLEQARKLYKQEAEMVPFTIWPGIIALSKISITDNGVNYSFGRMDGYFRKSYMMAYWDLLAMNKFAKIFYDLYCKPKDIDQYFNEYQLISLEMDSLYHSCYDKNPTDCSQQEFSEIISQVQRAYTSFWLKSFFIETFDAGFDQQEINLIGAKHSFAKSEIEVLTRPVDLTAQTQQKLALLKIALKMVGKKEPLEKLMEKFKTQIDAYKEQFDYSKSNYANVHHINNDELKSQLEVFLKNPSKIKIEIKKIERFSAFQANQIQTILKRHHIRTNPLYFFNRLAYFRDHRKTVNLKGFHILDFVLARLETETGIGKKYLKFISFEEIDSVIKGLISQETLEKRFEQGMLVSINYSSQGEIKIFEGKEAHSIIEELSYEYSNTDLKKSIIKGFTASQGFAKGEAKIILSEKDFGKFNKGDILVTSMTKADFLPLIEIAAGIVTDEGGISSHAATVARELGKPCIIGTNNATRVIKNDDLIEVRANHGTVRTVK